MADRIVPIEVSARHVHLSAADAATLFGAGYELTSEKAISQPGQFAARETVRVVGPKNSFDRVRIIGPLRPETQVEISMTDGYMLGIKPVMARSGVLENSTGGLTIIGPQGEIKMTKGIIVAQRHLHISPAQAKEWSLHNLDIISIRVDGPRAVIFNKVVVRAREGIDTLSFMLDTDEANAAGVAQGDQGILIP